MALKFIDGFDHYTGGATFLRKWTASRNITPATFTTGRFGTAWNGGERWSRKDFGSSWTTWIIGCAVQLSVLTVTDALWNIWDNATPQVELRYNPFTHTFQFTRNGTNIGGSYVLVPASLQWYYIEAKVTIDNTVGSVELRIDGVTVIGPTGSLDTQNSANASGNQLRLGSAGDNSAANVDDLYILDDSGGAPLNTFLGDCRVEALLPNGNGNSSQLLGSDGNSTDNYLLVDESGNPNDDTDYVDGDTLAEKDTYTFGNLATASGTVFGVQLIPTVRKTDAGARNIKTVARLSATETDGPDVVLGTGYAMATDIRETKPGGGSWTIADVNSAEFGIKVSL